ncbi:MAG: amidohydrolase family protein [Rhizomicrobium sp.]
MTDALQTIMPKMPTAPKAALPREACDAHTHVFGPFDRFPLMLPPAYPPPEAPEARHLQMQTTVGARHGVIVQPAPYYTDPRCLIDALKQSTGRLRGIAIANPDVTDGVLHELDTAGARGLRFVDMFDPSGNRFGGAVSATLLPELAPRMKALGWHAEFWANIDHHLKVLPELTKLGIPIMLDHMAGFDAAKGVAHADFQSLLHYLGEGKVHVKLSLCRRSANYPRYDELKPFHDALVAANPDNLMWGSDWPYVAMGDSAPDVGVMLDLFQAWVPDASVRQKILVDNPARLYRF